MSDDDDGSKMHPIATIALASISTSLEIFVGILVGAIAAHPRFKILSESRVRKRLGRIMLFVFTPLFHIRNFAVGLDIDLVTSLWILPLWGLGMIIFQYLLAELFFFRCSIFCNIINDKIIQKICGRRIDCGGLLFWKKKEKTKNRETIIEDINVDKIDNEEEKDIEIELDDIDISEKIEESNQIESDHSELSEVNQSNEENENDESSEEKTKKEEEEEKEEKRREKEDKKINRLMYVLSASMPNSGFLPMVYVTSLALNAKVFDDPNVESHSYAFISLYVLGHPAFFFSYIFSLIGAHTPEHMKKKKKSSIESSSEEEEIKEIEDSENSDSKKDFGSIEDDDDDEEEEEGEEEELEKEGEEEEEEDGGEEIINSEEQESRILKLYNNIPPWGCLCCFQKKSSSDRERNSIFSEKKKKIKDGYERIPKIFRCPCDICFKISLFCVGLFKKVFINPIMIAMIIGMIIGVSPPLKSTFFTDPPPVVISIPNVIDKISNCVLGLALVVVGANVGTVLFTPKSKRKKEKKNKTGEKEEEEDDDDDNNNKKKKESLRVRIVKELKFLFTLKHASCSGACMSIFVKLIVCPAIGFLAVLLLAFTVGEYIIEEKIRGLVYLILLVESGVPLMMNLNMVMTIFDFGVLTLSEIMLLQYLISPITLAIYTTGSLYFVCSIEKCNL